MKYSDKTAGERRHPSVTWRRALSTMILLAGTLSWPATIQAADAVGDHATPPHAAIIMYHRFGENRIPSTNIRLEQFDAQLAELKTGGYTVLPLAEIVRRFQHGESLPDRSVGISVDDAYESFYREAWPRLKRAGFPVTLFVTVEPIDSHTRGYMTWDQLREVQAEGVTIGHHTYRHQHMPAESEAGNAADLAKASARYAAELHATPTLFAYPYGEWSAANEKMVRDLGFVAAFGQHSGVAHADHDQYWLPRFPFNETYGEIARFRQAVTSLPLPLAALEPADPLLKQNPPQVRFTVPTGIDQLDKMVCYPSPSGPIKIENLGERRYAINIAKAYPEGRGRLSCTLPAGNSRYRWFGVQYFITK